MLIKAPRGTTLTCAETATGRRYFWNSQRAFKFATDHMASDVRRSTRYLSVKIAPAQAESHLARGEVALAADFTQRETADRCAAEWRKAGHRADVVVVPTEDGPDFYEVRVVKRTPDSKVGDLLDFASL